MCYEFDKLPVCAKKNVHYGGYKLCKINNCVPARAYCKKMELFRTRQLTIPMSLSFANNQVLRPGLDEPQTAPLGNWNMDDNNGGVSTNGVYETGLQAAELANSVHCQKQATDILQNVGGGGGGIVSDTLPSQIDNHDQDSLGSMKFSKLYDQLARELEVESKTPSQIMKTFRGRDPVLDVDFNGSDCSLDALTSSLIPELLAPNYVPTASPQPFQYSFKDVGPLDVAPHQTAAVANWHLDYNNSNTLHEGHEYEQQPRYDHNVQLRQPVQMAEFQAPLSASHSPYHGSVAVANQLQQLQLGHRYPHQQNHHMPHPAASTTVPGGGFYPYFGDNYYGQTHMTMAPNMKLAASLDDEKHEYESAYRSSLSSVPETKTCADTSTGNRAHYQQPDPALGISHTDQQQPLYPSAQPMSTLIPPPRHPENNLLRLSMNAKRTSHMSHTSQQSRASQTTSSLATSSRYSTLLTTTHTNSISHHEEEEERGNSRSTADDIENENGDNGNDHRNTHENSNENGTTIDTNINDSGGADSKKLDSTESSAPVIVDYNRIIEDQKDNTRFQLFLSALDDALNPDVCESMQFENNPADNYHAFSSLVPRSTSGAEMTFAAANGLPGSASTVTVTASSASPFVAKVPISKLTKRFGGKKHAKPPSSTGAGTVTDQPVSTSQSAIVHTAASDDGVPTNNAALLLNLDLRTMNNAQVQAINRTDIKSEPPSAYRGTCHRHEKCQNKTELFWRREAPKLDSSFLVNKQMKVTVNSQKREHPLREEQPAPITSVKKLDQEQSLTREQTSDGNVKIQETSVEGATGGTYTMALQRFGRRPYINRKSTDSGDSSGNGRLVRKRDSKDNGKNLRSFNGSGHMQSLKTSLRRGFFVAREVAHSKSQRLRHRKVQEA